ncbi:MAG TPA: hypothetical protein ENN35_00920 [Deltaproteobacteria bacterium]|nr:hypothetical protein [Deltaproteobacteria bacterium]
MNISRREFIRQAGTGCAVVLLATGGGIAAPVSVLAGSIPRPTKDDRCPVCGMFAYKYPHWMAGYVFKDGTKVFFCSPKCFFHNLFNMDKYQPGKTRDDLELIWVTDYYTAKPVNAEDPDMRYVAGSTLVGPMGWDVVPVKGVDAAETLKRDYFGEEILRLDDVTPDHIERARKGGGRKTKY